MQARAGVDHVAVFQTGKRSVAAEVRTVSFFSSLTEAYAMYAEYLTLVNSGVAVGVIHAGVAMPYKVQALDCRRGRDMPRRHLFGMGAGYISRARLVCVWRLQVVEVIEEDP